MNTYLISLTSYHLLNEEISKIVKDSTNIMKFDYEEDSLATILEEASYFSFFDEKKYIIISNANLFSSDKLKEEESEMLLNYFKEPNLNSVLVFTLYRPIDGRKAITKYLEKNGTVITKDNPNEKEMVNIITALLKKEGIKISYLGTNYLVNSCRNDYDIIMSEIDKIKIYIGESHEISDDELKKVVCDSSEVSNFNFSDSVVKKDYNKALKILDVLKDNKVEIHMLIGLLSSQYRLIYTVKELSQKGLSESEIFKKVGGHPYSLKLAINNSFNYSYKELREWLKDLANLDYKIKSGTFTGYMPLEMLLLER